MLSHYLLPINRLNSASVIKLPASAHTACKKTKITSYMTTTAISVHLPVAAMANTLPWVRHADLECEWNCNARGNLSRPKYCLQ
jgi:hypothetical protein